MGETDLTKLPEPDAKDMITSLYFAAVSSVPVVGGALRELMSMVVVTSLDKRRKKFFENLATGLIELKQKIDSFEFKDLPDNDTFTTAFMHATASALKNHQKEKLEALKNAVLNSATTNAPNEDLQLMFINNIDRMTQWHIRILNFFHCPEKWEKKDTVYNFTGPIDKFLSVIFPELTGQNGFIRKIINDLNADGLIRAGGLFLEMQQNEVFSSRTTDMGDEFIKFITTPI